MKFYLFQVYHLELLPTPVNTSKLFQETARNEVGLGLISIDILVSLSLDFQEIHISRFLLDYIGF